MYVYLNTGNGFKVSNPTILSGYHSLSSGNGIPGSRFGSAMGSIGDINKDGMNDVAIGAPYEDDNQGAVYIYHGKRIEGLRNEYAQVLISFSIS